MGTSYSLKYYSLNSGHSKELVQAKVEETLKEVNQLASTYQASSEISLINLAPASRPIKISKQFSEMFKRLLEIHELTEGYFDPTIGPLVNLFGFGPLGPKKVPTEAEIKRARSAIGINQFTLNFEEKYLIKKVDNAYLDFSASAKGFGVDKVIETLKGMEIEQALVEIGGDIRTIGAGPQKGGFWNLAIEMPQDSGRSIHKIFEVNELAMATSGDYRNYFTFEEKRYSHTIDPIQGKVIEHQLASVSVLSAKDCETADALATALNAMGETKAFEFAESKHIPAYFIIKNGQGLNGFVVKSTSKWNEIIKMVTHN